MAGTKFDFANPNGDQLSGVLEIGSRPPRAYAVFAHCFTCDKASLAATRLSRALADQGVGVLRFDFTGLGESEGAFGRGLSADVADVVCAAKAMQAAAMGPQLLIGHSFGGAAVLAAANALHTVKAVAVIGAPFDPEHVLTHIGSPLDGVSDDRGVPVSIGGREFRLGAGFVEDVRGQHQQARIAELGRALLVLHSPTDEIVSIGNASSIFQAARHPKSFVSLDGADHLLRRKADADYAANVIAAWSGRYLDPANVEVPEIVTGVRVAETGAGKFQVRIVTPSSTFLADEPLSVGGLGSGPTPYELLSASLGACTAMTCRLYAGRKGWPLQRVLVEVSHTGKAVSEPDCFVRKLTFEGTLDEGQQARLLEIADRCPVHRTLTESARVSTEQIGGGTPDCPEDHFRQMDEACAGADRASGLAPDRPHDRTAAGSGTA